MASPQQLAIQGQIGNKLAAAAVPALTASPAAREVNVSPSTVTPGQAPVPGIATGPPPPAPPVSPPAGGSTGSTSSTTTIKAGPLAYAGQDPTIPNLSFTKAEHEARLEQAMEALREAESGYEDQYREMAARAGLDPSSGVTQAILGKMLQSSVNAQGDIRTANFLQEEQAMRERDELLANLRAGLENTRVGSAANVQSSQIGANAQTKSAGIHAAAQKAAAEIGSRADMARVALERERLPYELFSMMSSPYNVDNPDLYVGEEDVPTEWWQRLMAGSSQGWAASG